MLWMISGSAMTSPTVKRGLSEAYGSWKMIWTSRRNALSSAELNLRTSRPSNMTEPPVGSIRRMMARPVVDFPHPDSPTSPSVLRASSSNETPSTAFTTPFVREKAPVLTEKYFCSSWT